MTRRLRILWRRLRDRWPWVSAARYGEEVAARLNTSGRADQLECQLRAALADAFERGEQLTRERLDSARNIEQAHADAAALLEEWAQLTIDERRRNGFARISYTFYVPDAMRALCANRAGVACVAFQILERDWRRLVGGPCPCPHEQPGWQKALPLGQPPKHEGGGRFPGTSAGTP